MQKGLLLLIVILISSQLYSQTPNWAWARGSSGCTWRDEGINIARDNSGNLYVVGYFRSTITFGSVTLSDNNGHDNMFIVKYDSNGNVLWGNAATEGGSGGANAQAVCTDLNGNIFVTGLYSGTITFGTYTLSNSGAYVVKYDSLGNVLWAKSGGGAYSQIGTGISADSDGNVFATGYFGDESASSSMVFGSTTLSTNGIGYDIFIVKYDSSGTLLWAKKAGGTGMDWASRLSTDTYGNAYIVGRYYSSSIVFGSTTLTNSGSSTSDIYFVKYDSNGDVVWAKSATNANNDFCDAIFIDPNNNIYLAGRFYDIPITIGSATLTSAGVWDIFVAKYDINGNLIWAKSAGGIYSEFAYGVCADANGNVFVAGDFGSSPFTFGTSTLTTNDGGDICVLKWNSAGTPIWAKSASGNFADYSQGIVTDNYGNAYITGSFESNSITFGTTTLTNSFQSSNLNDFYIAKLGNLVGVDEISDIHSLMIYPNPSKGAFTMEVLPQLHNKNLCIYNIYGSEIYKTKLTQGLIELKIEGLTSGIYLLKVEGENYFQKIIID